MTLHLPLGYNASNQQLGETRQAMAKRLMKDVEEIISMPKCKKVREKYYIMFHSKPYPNNQNLIKIKRMVVFGKKPPMMLSCMLFGVDNEKSVLTLEWALPGNWPTWSVGGTNEPVAETIASITELGKVCNLDSVLAY
jgi:hypothetical protein